jgi:hypothetical protein
VLRRRDRAKPRPVSIEFDPTPITTVGSSLNRGCFERSSTIAPIAPMSSSTQALVNQKLLQRAAIELHN